MVQLSIIPPRVTVGPYFASYDSLGFWAGIKGKWECSWHPKEGWISGKVPEKRSGVESLGAVAEDEGYDVNVLEARHKA
jgi:hypothetical protein